jgi:uncharacterized protein (TIGR03083 family)
VDSLADRTIAALRGVHDELTAAVSGLSDAELSSPSGAADWTVAHVLSHLGSGAEITLATLRAALDGAPAPQDGFNEAVWDRWNALGPREQATEVVQHDAELVDTLEALTPDQRENLHIDLGFLPAPLPLAAVAGMRLNEAAQHAWDVLVTLDPTATVDATAANVLAEHLAGRLEFMLGFTGRAGNVSKPASMRIGSSELVIAIDDKVSLSTSLMEASATFTGELEAAIRLIGGRLTPRYTPDGVEVTGNVTLDELRRVFSGY